MSKLFVQTTEIPNGVFNPVFQDRITPRTKLGEGITMAKFLGSHGDPVTMNLVLTDADKLTLAKQYYLHARALQMINSSESTKKFENFRLEVLEGYYEKGPGETLDETDGINFLLSTGQAVVYHLIGSNGKIAIEETFDLAVYWKNNLNFEKLILDYDTYNPDGSLHACIILVMPEIVSPWRVSYNNEVETRFNNNVQATNELLEVLEPSEDLESVEI